jgi:hypothetical protein
MDSLSMQTSLGLSLQERPAVGRTKDNTRVPLTPGSEVYMRGVPPGTFGIRHAPSSAAYGGGATVLIISDEAKWYSDIDSHLGTVEAILHRRSRPRITYSSARSVEGRLDTAYSVWSRGLFERLYQDSLTWSRNYSSQLDAEFSKVYIFLRQPKWRSYICLGRYSAHHFDGHVLTLCPIDVAHQGATTTPAMDLLASTAERLSAVITPSTRARQHPLVDPETHTDEDGDDEPILERFMQQRNVRPRTD